MMSEKDIFNNPVETGEDLDDLANPGELGRLALGVTETSDAGVDTDKTAYWSMVIEGLKVNNPVTFKNVGEAGLNPRVDWKNLVAYTAAVMQMHPNKERTSDEMDAIEKCIEEAKEFYQSQQQPEHMDA